MVIRVIKVEVNDNRNQDQFVQSLRDEGYNSFRFKVKGSELYLVAKP